MWSTVRRFMDDRSGASAVEYGLLSVLFVILIIGSWSKMGNELGNFFTDVANMFVNQAN
jgi:Flp pilus assembly pilin Flp